MCACMLVIYPFIGFIRLAAKKMKAFGILQPFFSQKNVSVCCVCIVNFLSKKNPDAFSFMY